MAHLGRNRWRDRIGSGGWFGSESLAPLIRTTQLTERSATSLDDDIRTTARDRAKRCWLAWDGAEWPWFEVSLQRMRCRGTGRGTVTVLRLSFLNRDKNLRAPFNSHQPPHLCTAVLPCGSCWPCEISGRQGRRSRIARSAPDSAWFRQHRQAQHRREDGGFVRQQWQAEAASVGTVRIHRFRNAEGRERRCRLLQQRWHVPES